MLLLVSSVLGATIPSRYSLDFYRMNGIFNLTTLTTTNATINNLNVGNGTNAGNISANTTGLYLQGTDLIFNNARVCLSNGSFCSGWTSTSTQINSNLDLNMTGNIKLGTSLQLANAVSSYIRFTEANTQFLQGFIIAYNGTGSGDANVLEIRAGGDVNPLNATTWFNLTRDTGTATFVGPLRANFTTLNGTKGYTGTCSNLSVITVVAGIITACT